MGKEKPTGAILIIICLLALIIFGVSKQFAITGGNVKFAIPHMASYKCEVIGSKAGLTLGIPSGGTIVNRENIGHYTNAMQNIKLTFVAKYTPIYSQFRVGYSKCDVNGNYCNAYTYITKQGVWGEKTYTEQMSSIDVTKESLKLIYERHTVLSGWYPVEGLSITFDSDVFGLALYSTTRDPAGAKICTTSCNLDCPDVGYREKLILTDKTKLEFFQTAPYLEYWESIDYDLNMQGGATIYNQNTNTFCFAGAIYTAGQLKMDNGVTYIYPVKNTRQNKECCSGATISASYSDMVCQSDYSWKVIQDTDKLTCISDYNCPAQGGATCQNRVLSGYHCKNKDSNGVGLCVKSSGSNVECCLNSDCNRDMVCDLSTHRCKGGSILPVCGDNVIQLGEECDDGNTRSGDGCSAYCQLEAKCGNGMFEAGEECDDGNTKSGDGCDEFCKLEGKECESCFAWLTEKVTKDTYCTPKPADKLLWFIKIPMTSQDTLCPIFLTILGSIVVLTITGMIVMVKNKD